MRFGSKTMSAASRIAISRRWLACGVPDGNAANTRRRHRGQEGAREELMSEQARNASRYSLAAGMLAGLVCAGASGVLAQSPPDFSGANLGWVAVGTEWTAVPGG